MSEAYENDLAEEQAIFERIEAAEPEPEVGGETPRGKMGRPPKVDPIKLVAWRQAHKATAAETAARWKVSKRTVQQLCRDYGEAAKQERKRWQMERVDRELDAAEYEFDMMFLRERNRRFYWTSFGWFGALEAARGTDREAALNEAHEAALDKADRDFREEWERLFGPVPGSKR